MEVLQRVIDYNRSDVFYLYPFSDSHLGARESSERLLEKKVKECANRGKYGLAVGVGDYTDCITKNDKRFRMNGLADWVEKCLHPNTRVLKTDLHWVKISELSVGDKLVGIDEQKRFGKRRRLLCETVIEAINYTQHQDAYKIIFENGNSVIASKNHKWLCKKFNKWQYDWATTEELKPGSMLQACCDVWEEDDSYDAGYIAGFLDGEGHAGFKNRNYVGFVQADNGITEKISAILTTKGFRFNEKLTSIMGSKKKRYKSLFIQNRKEVWKLLGSIRPKRLLDKVVIDGKDVCAEHTQSYWKVKEIIPCGSYRLVDIQTACHTFVAEGVFSHNSNIVESQRRRVVDIFKPLQEQGQLIGLGTGNHEESIHNQHDNDITRNICRDLKVPYAGYHAFIVLHFRRARKLTHSIVIHSWHGSGAAQTEGARLNRLTRLVNDIQADIYLMGHLHAMTAHTPDRLRIKNGKIQSVRLAATLTGSWLKTYNQPEEGEVQDPSYGEEKGYKTSRIGCPIIRITPENYKDPDEDEFTIES